MDRMWDGSTIPDRRDQQLTVKPTNIYGVQCYVKDLSKPETRYRRCLCASPSRLLSPLLASTPPSRIVHRTSWLRLPAPLTRFKSSDARYCMMKVDLGSIRGRTREMRDTESIQWSGGSASLVERLCMVDGCVGSLSLLHHPQ